MFGSCGTNAQIEIKLDGVNMSDIKFLGVITDDKMIWKAHISNVQK